MSAELLSFPSDVFARWRVRFPAEAAADPDPRLPFACRAEDCQTFAWRGYDGLCGWCHDEPAAA